jgi:hypothetical protein
VKDGNNMPSKSKKQHNLMEAVAHSPAFAKKVGIPQSVGKDFAAADKGKKFKGGGMMDKEDLKQDKMLIKKAFKQHDAQEHKGSKGTSLKLKKGGACKGYAKGGIIEKSSGEKYASKSAMMKHEKKETKAEEMKEEKMCGGGGMAKKYARGGGIEVRGKTKGKIC